MCDLLGYAGPIVASFVFNGIWSAFGALCVYLYLNRGSFKSKGLLLRLSKPFHLFVKRIAVARLRDAFKKDNETSL